MSSKSLHLWTAPPPPDDDNEEDEEKGVASAAAFRAVVQILGESVKVHSKHNVELIKTLTNPLNHLLEMLQRQNDSQAERITHMEKDYYEAQKERGEMLLRKEEIILQREEAKAKSEVIKKAGNVAVGFIPKLLKQAAGEGTLDKFSKLLTPTEREGMWQMREAFDGEKKDLLTQMLKSMGVEEPKEEPKEEPDENPKEGEENDAAE